MPQSPPSRTVLVYGSNLQGINGAGAALDAARHFGAQRGVGEGRTGRAYAIPTKSTPYRVRSLDDIAVSVRRFIEYANEHPQLHFRLTRIGCGLAGYSERVIAPLFANAPRNVILIDDTGRDRCAAADWQYQVSS